MVPSSALAALNRTEGSEEQDCFTGIQTMAVFFFKGKNVAPKSDLISRIKEGAKTDKQKQIQSFQRICSIKLQSWMEF